MKAACFSLCFLPIVQQWTDVRHVHDHHRCVTMDCTCEQNDSLETVADSYGCCQNIWKFTCSMLRTQTTACKSISRHCLCRYCCCLCSGSLRLS